MKAILRIIALMVVFFSTAKAQSDNIFRLTCDTKKTIKPNCSTLDHSTTLTPFTKRDSIIGLSVDAVIIQPKNSSLVRIILEDEKGNEHLVLESNRIINDMDTLYVSNYCEETALMTATNPRKLKVIVKDAMVKFTAIHLADASKRNLGNNKVEAKAIKKAQVSNIAERINDYNKRHNKLWRAGITPLALKSYADRKSYFNCNNDEYDNDYVEYYVGGIFEFGDSSGATNVVTSNNSPYVEAFDWRNRHGINWLSPHRDQGDSGMCVCFSLVAMTEALVNLYYNQKLDLDLSEVDLAIYGVPGRTYASYFSYYLPDSTHHNMVGLSMNAPISYLLTEGVADEASIPFVNSYTQTYPPIRGCVNEIITLNDCKRVYNSDNIPVSKFDSIKKYLIKYGPLHGGYSRKGGGGHSLSLIGYKRIQAGDSLTWATTQYGLKDTIVVGNDHPYIGMDMWIFKENYGPNSSFCGDGYFRAVFTTSAMRTPYYGITPISSLNHTNADIHATDNDNDGYYFWGLGEKPASLPFWVPNNPDGNDADINKGPMDEYGYLEDLTIPEYINEDTNWNSHTIHNNIIVNSGNTLTISHDVYCFRNAVIQLKNGATLIVDGCTLNNAKLSPASGAYVKVLNNGSINIAHGNSFSIPLGAETEVTSGTISINQ